MKLFISLLYYFICSISLMALDHVGEIRVEAELLCNLPLGDGDFDFSFIYGGNDPSIGPETPFIIEDKYIGILDYVKAQYLVYDFEGKFVAVKKMMKELVLPYNHTIIDWFYISDKKYVDSSCLYIQMSESMLVIMPDRVSRRYRFPFDLKIHESIFLNNMLFGWTYDGLLFCSPEESYVKFDGPAPCMDETAIKRALLTKDPRFKGLNYYDKTLYMDGRPVSIGTNMERFFKNRDSNWEDDKRHKVKPSLGCFDGDDKDGNTYWGEFSIYVMNKDGFFTNRIQYSFKDPKMFIYGAPVVNSNGDIFFIANKGDQFPENQVFNLYRIKRIW